MLGLGGAEHHPNIVWWSGCRTPRAAVERPGRRRRRTRCPSVRSVLFERCIDLVTLGIVVGNAELVASPWSTSPPSAERAFRES